MRFLHTADWHLGHSLNGWARDGEHRVFFERLARIIEEEQVDVLLVSGDIYDGINPSGESQKILFDALAEFRRRRPDLLTIMTSGNHDPAGRLEAPEAILSGQGTKVIGTVRRQDEDVDLQRHIIEVPGPDGAPAAVVMAVPFLRAADMPGLSFADSDPGRSPIVDAARSLHRQMAAAARAAAGDLPIIAMGHLTCIGGEESEGAERRILIGGEHALPIDVFDEDIAYVALGHLHGPQSLDGGRIRYSGSCFPLSAAEIRYRHGVTLIDLADGNVEWRHVEIPRPAEFYRLPATGNMSLDEFRVALDALDLDPETPADLQPFVYGTLSADGPASVILAEAEAVLSGYPVRTAGLKVQRDVANDAPVVKVASLQDTTPEKLFIEAFRKINDTDPEARHLAAFRDAAAEV